MITAYNCPALSSALGELKKIIIKNRDLGRQTVIFCEDRLTLAAERTVCQAVEGTFSVYVYTFARFLSAECGKAEGLLSSQGSAMAIRKIIDDNRGDLKLFKRLNTATAAQDVYDTIALLYSSRVSPDDLDADCGSGLLGDKLHDLKLLYSQYNDYLQRNNLTDRNGYLSRLPDVIRSSAKIRESEVVFLGFQSFTCPVSECAAACMETAPNVTGLFIGGKQDIYVNEALASFSVQAKSFGGLNLIEVKSVLCPEAEQLRENLFNPECFSAAERLKTDRVHIFEAENIAEEIEFVAASIIKHVFDEGVRFQAISVMTPDLKKYQGTVERVFSEYGIPFYADRRYALSEHPVSSFICGYLSCVSDGCTPESVIAVVCSPLFGADKKDRDIFVNYTLRLAAYRGGVKRTPDENILNSLNYDISAVERVRTRFLDGLKLLPAKGDGGKFGEALRRLNEYFATDEVTASLYETFKDEYPSLAAFSSRAAECALSVIAEAENLTAGLNLTAREFSKILKSGFSAMEISLIPPKQDAVFVSETGSTANMGSEVVFAVGLTGEVPCATADTAILTDRELISLEKLKIIISPKIEQVNRRARELTALNVCAFRKKLYLTYPLEGDGGVSEIISYARRIFSSPSGAPLSPLNKRKLDRSEKAAPYYASRPLPAIRLLTGGRARPRLASAVYGVLCDNGCADIADAALSGRDRGDKLTLGGKLYGGSISPTALETYFSCPYKSFMTQGLKVAEREEGAMRPLDSGNFIHGVLEGVAKRINAIESPEELSSAAREIAERQLKLPQYSALSSGKRGEYAAKSLTEEAVKVSLGMFEQLKNSRFTVSEAEKRCEISLDNGLKLYGRIDRVDGCGDMVRIIDYKTGTIDGSAPSYYMGLKLQLPLYLVSASKGKRAVGAYYFPAQIEFKDKQDGVFRLRGFMDASEDVVKNSDTTLEEKQKSRYFDAYLNGKQPDIAMTREDFADFLAYSGLVARKGANEMVGGFVSPSPYDKACDYCKLAGSCGFAGGESRSALKVNCAKIAEIVRKERGDEQ